jgi:hypothetical protein
MFTTSIPEDVAADFKILPTPNADKLIRESSVSIWMFAAAVGATVEATVGLAVGDVVAKVGAGVGMGLVVRMTSTM